MGRPNRVIEAFKVTPETKFGKFSAGAGLIVIGLLTACEEGRPTALPQAPSVSIEYIPSKVTSYKGILLSPYSNRLSAEIPSSGKTYDMTVTSTMSPQGESLPLKFAQFKNEDGEETTVPVWPVFYTGEVNGKPNISGVQFYEIKPESIGEPTKEGTIPVTISKESLVKPLYSFFFQQGKTYKDFINKYHELVDQGKGKDQQAIQDLISQYVEIIAVADPNAKTEDEANKTAVVLTRESNNFSDILVSLLTGAENAQAAQLDEPFIIKLANTETPQATAVSTATATPEGNLPKTTEEIPTYLEGLSTQIRDPRETQPELFDIENPSSHLNEFVKALNEAGLNVAPEEVRNSLTFTETTAVNGSLVTTGNYNVSIVFDETEKPTQITIPLFIAIKGENGEVVWRKTIIRDGADITGRQFAAPLSATSFTEKYKTYQERLLEANHGIIMWDLDARVVFGNYTSADFRLVVDNWDLIHEQLERGDWEATMKDVRDGKFTEDISQLFEKLSWSQADTALRFAKEHNMTIRAQHLLWGFDWLPSIVDGGFSQEDLTKILEFTTKVRVLKYEGEILEWDVGDENLTNILFRDTNGNNSFWFKQLGEEGKEEEVMFQVARWAHEADPYAILVYNEDRILHKEFPGLLPRLRERFMRMLDEIKAEGVPITRISIENNFWIYDPPERDFMVSILRQITEKGFDIAAPETQVVTSKTYAPFWFPDPPKTVQEINNKDMAQARIYWDTVQAYLQIGNKMGVGALDDKENTLKGNPYIDSAIINREGDPKLAYFLLLAAMFQK